MKNKGILIVMGLAALTSCSSEIVAPISQEAVALGINVNVLGAKTKTIIETEAFANPAKIGILLGSDNDYTAQVTTYNQTASTDAWVADKAIFLSNKDANIYGFYPTTANADAITELKGSKKLNINISATDDFKGTTQNDYMYATNRTGDGTPGSPFVYSQVTASNAKDSETVKLWFHHALSQLTFKVNKHADFKGECKLSEIKLSNKAANGTDAGVLLASDGKMLVTNGTIDQLTATSDITLTAATAVVVSNQQDTDTDYGKVQVGTDPKFLIKALVAPITLPTEVVALKDATVSNSIQLTLKVDGKPMSTFLPNVASAKWEMGKNYIYTITVNPTTLVVDKQVSIVGWAEGTSVGGLNIN